MAKSNGWNPRLGDFWTESIIEALISPRCEIIAIDNPEESISMRT